ncbi:MAG: HEAT repeat domain-containing protein [Gammaproteobacteria bacterium]|nr:HEAT repeat domain-containing protein [Gammaproteobacteria bacterium]
MTLVTLDDAAPIVRLAFWLGIAVMAMTVLMLAVTLTMRRAALRRRRIHDQAVARWRPLVQAQPQPDAVALPELNARELSGFIRVWNEAHEPLRGGSTQNLARIAGELGLEALLHPFLQARSFHDRVVAVIALGHVRSASSFARVSAFLDDHSPIMSLCAARALMQIDPRRGVLELVPRIVARADWSQGSIAAILQECAESAVAEALTEATLRANPADQPRLLRFLAGVSPGGAAPIIRARLAAADDEEMISTCLQVIANPADLDCVRPLLEHPRWHLRMQAAVTMGRLGVPGDEQRLVRMLTDRQWWVRYRAARALAGLAFVGRERMRAIQQAQTDAYARDIIEQVLAERAIGDLP